MSAVATVSVLAQLCGGQCWVQLGLTRGSAVRSRDPTVLPHAFWPRRTQNVLSSCNAPPHHGRHDVKVWVSLHSSSSTIKKIVRPRCTERHELCSCYIVRQIINCCDMENGIHLYACLECIPLCSWLHFACIEHLLDILGRMVHQHHRRTPN